MVILDPFIVSTTPSSRMRTALFAFLCIATIVLDAHAILVPVTGKVHYFSDDDRANSDSMWLFNELALNEREPVQHGYSRLCNAVTEKQSTLTSSDMIIVFSGFDFCNTAPSGPSVIQFRKKRVIEMKYRIGNGGSITVTAAADTNTRKAITELLKIAFFDKIIDFFEPIRSLSSYSNIFAIISSLVGGLAVKQLSDNVDEETLAIQTQLRRLQPADVQNTQRYTYTMQLPHTAADFRKWMKYIVEIIIDYKEHPEVYKVLTDQSPGFIINTWSQTAPKKPDDFEEILKDIMQKVIPNMTHWQHPRFHAYFATGCSYPDILADTLISGFGNVSFNWDSCPAYAEMEVIVMNWLGRVFGLPDEFLFTIPNPNEGTGGGAMQDSASDCVLVALITARERFVRPYKAADDNKKAEEDKENADPKKNSKLDPKNFTERKSHHKQLPFFVAYASKEAHSCLEKATKLTCVHLHVVEPNDTMEMTWENLKAAMEHDLEVGRTPLFVHVTTGTTATGAFDKLRDIGEGLRGYTAPEGKSPEIKKTWENLMKTVWIHVDGAYGGTLWTLKTQRTDETGWTGLKDADSVNINLHKIFLHSSSAGCIWTRNQKELKDAMSVDPVYLKPADNKAIDFRNYGIPLTRRQRFMKAWFVLRMYGVNGMEAYIKQLIKMSQYMRKLLERNPYVELIGQLTYTVSCFRLNTKTNLTKQQEEHNLDERKELIRPDPITDENEKNELTEKLAAYINATCRLAVTKAKPNGKTVVRISVSHQMSQEKEIKESHDILVKLIKLFNAGVPSKNVGHRITLEDDPGVHGEPMDGDLDKTAKSTASPAPGQQSPVGRVTSSANIASPSGSGN